MNRYDTAFTALRSSASMGFIPFAVAHDPDMETSLAIFKTYIDAGADILEIGYPFSDPIADGPVNQRAGQRAIAAGLDHARFFKLVDSIRRYTDVPIGVLLYTNTLIHLGYDQFFAKAKDSGIDSILSADLPPEEAAPMLCSIKQHDLKSVFIVSELTPQQRMKYICDHVTGFVYVVSRLGATGTDATLSGSIKGTISRLKKVTDKPLCVGFGLSTPQHIAEVKQCGAQGAIVGSALVRTIEENLSNTKAMLTRLRKQVAAYKKASE